MNKIVYILIFLLIQGCAVTPFEKEYYTEFADRGKYGFEKGLTCGNDWFDEDIEVDRFKYWQETGIIVCKGKISPPELHLELTEQDKAELEKILKGEKI
tara:strand:+ start:1002 stop:1298 length:297 start_codon:yes stop_codon:yes gene_type:complete